MGLEASLRSKVALQSPMIQLIIRHPAFVFTRYRVGQDGRTAYKRLVGRDWNVSVAESGE